VRIYISEGEGRIFFFEKKKQKTFDFFWLRRLWIGSAQGRKSFLVPFFKKEPLSSPMRCNETGRNP
jgi:hypothetical protein